MSKAEKYEIVKMLIPVIGTWWVIKRILPDLGPITWWDYSNKTPFVIIGIVAYQAICWLSWKYIYTNYLLNNIN